MQLVIIVLSLLFAACSTLGNPVLDKKPTDWPPPTMTKAQLIQELGPPKSTSTRTIGGKQIEVLLWAYTKSVMFTSRSKILSVEFEGETMVDKVWSQTEK
ncbi:exported protein of unknown function [Nitrospira japonica]|uniref:Lipoprotein SmpA/OmlA domain-containing protein n=1 Tax=Nitrospira japonica TaxID=1325564 RepID=A0A1W1I124_9BACT|nr:hypothetical protein [Nitrospira japonica]SLM46569.1 exported protein of unknown function [Nitrospira japonica]